MAPVAHARSPAGTTGTAPAGPPPPFRYDIKLSLQEPAVRSALEEALRAAGPACAHVLGPRPELFELGALVADGGAPRQPVHPDTPWHEAAAVVSCFVAPPARQTGRQAGRQASRQAGRQASRQAGRQAGRQVYG